MSDSDPALADLRGMDPYEFEHLVATIFEQRGYSTEVSKRSLDGGMDVLADNGSERVAIQAKRYGPNNSVGVKTIRETSNLTNRPDIDRAAVVTTSSYTRPALKEANQYGVKLYDGDDLRRMYKGSSSPAGRRFQSTMAAFAKKFVKFLVDEGNPLYILIRLAAVLMFCFMAVDLLGNTLGIVDLPGGV